MVAVRMRADIEVEIVFSYAKRIQIRKNPVFGPMSNGSPSPKRIARIRAIWIVATLAGIDHPKAAVTLNDNCVSSGARKVQAAPQQKAARESLSRLPRQRQRAAVDVQ